MSSCKPSRRSRGCAPTDYGRCKTLAQMIDLFLAERRGLQDRDTAWFGDRDLPLERACRRAFFALEDEDRRDDHQWTYDKNTLRALGERLAVWGGVPIAPPTFGDLYRSVERALGLRPNHKPLLVYDVARRLAFRFGREPEAVYLHAGARKGANALRVGLGRSRARSLDDFPTSMRARLTPAQAEDFLCVASKWLRPDLWD